MIKTDSISCNIKHTKNYFNEVNEITNLEHKIKYFTNTNLYIKSFIDYIKNNIIKNLENLNLVKINLEIYDKNNILHILIIKVTNIIHDLLKIKNKISINKSVFVSVTYNDEIKFIGHINFNGLD